LQIKKAHNSDCELFLLNSIVKFTQLISDNNYQLMPLLHFRHIQLLFLMIFGSVKLVASSNSQKANNMGAITQAPLEYLAHIISSDQNVHPPKPKVIPNLWIVKVKNKLCIQSFSLQLSNTDLIYSVQENTLNRTLKRNVVSGELQPSEPHLVFEINVIDSGMGLLSVRLKNADLNFWNENHSYITQSISKLEGIDIIQYSHEIVKRALPNDPLINRQLHLSQISVDKVWNYSSKAISKSGDTLVVAVIDDGYDTSHPDLKTNLFINHQEIPWNGIDDDGNSYIDDYQGWNSGDQNPLVFNEVSVYDGHGTSVAGVVGAAGNNEIGISGVAWTVKILPINCWPKNMTDVEIGLIRGMVYAYRMKQLYIMSGGKRGANIVALNQSLGMDNGYPEDAPLWCQMFDSLGSVGILNAAATTNRNIKIENFGDLPTMCPSKHLIMVSASNKDDQHYMSGYSTEFVDIAAPGVQIYTTQPMEFNQEDPYVAETGTSFSSPQLAASISLMHSLACDSFLRLYESNPQGAHELLITWLDSSVSKNSNLKQYTRTGGRLDVWQWYDEMRKWCKQVDTSFVGLTTLDKLNFRVFPNPLEHHILHIYLYGSQIHEEFQMQIVDFSGRVLDFWEVKGADLEQSSLEREVNLKSGTYFLHTTGTKSGKIQGSIFVVQ
jgi:hypothetical protein